jgi:glycosyltransferase involved in cell wall biosynthesis
MKFSIVTVCRNNQSTIARTIRSVNEQTHGGVQHIFIDGASTDGTVDVIEREARADKILVSERDSGIYDAMNKGINRAAGDVIAILNADDYYKQQDVLAKVARIFMTSHVDCVFGDVEYFRPEAPDVVVRRYNSGHFSPAGLAFGLMPAHPATFFLRHIYSKSGGFKTDYRISADFEFIARTFKDGSISYLHLKEALVRMQTGGVSSRGIKSKMILNREILRALRENGISSSYLHLAAKVPLKLRELFS